MHDLWDPQCRVEEQDCPRLVQQDVLKDNCGEAGHVEDYVEPGQNLALVLLVVRLLLVELRAPDQDKQTRFESETAQEVPKGRQSQVLHELALALNRELEVDGEEKEVPDQVHANGNR